MVLVHVRDGAGLGGDELVGIGEVGREPLRRHLGDAAEAGDDVGAGDVEPPEREVGEVDVAGRLGVAGEVAAARRGVVGIRGTEADEPALDAGTRRRESRSPSPAVATRSEARGSAARFAVWTARSERSSTGAPLGNVATATSEAKGAPVPGLSVASEPWRAARIRRRAVAAGSKGASTVIGRLARLFEGSLVGYPERRRYASDRPLSYFKFCGPPGDPL